MATTDFLENLRRRGVVRSMSYYFGISWVVVGACDILFPMLGINETMLRTVVWLILSGLPVVFIAAWFINFDDISQEEGETRRRTGIDLVIFAVLATILVAFAVMAYFGDSESTTPDLRSRKIQVYINPTEDLSPEPATAFARALDFEIQDRLNMIPNWDTNMVSDPSLPGYYLNPSIRLSDQIVRLSLSIKENPSGRLINSFSGDAVALNESLTQQRLGGVTSHIVYDSIYFEIEREQSFERTGNYAAVEPLDAARKNNRRSVYDPTACMRTITNDPSFEPAIACLAIISFLAPIETFHENGFRLVERMREINPQSPDADVAEAIYALLHKRNYEEAELLLLRAEESSPYSANALNALGYLYFVTGRLDNSLDAYQRLLPLVRTSDKFLSITAGYQFQVVAQAALAWDALIAEGKLKNPYLPMQAYYSAVAYAERGEPQAAAMLQDQLRRWESLTPRQKDMNLLVASLTGHEEEAATIFRELKALMEELPIDDPMTMALSWIYWGSTHYLVAQNRLDEAFDLLERSKFNPADYQLLVAFFAYTRNPMYQALRQDPRFESHLIAIRNAVQ